VGDGEAKERVQFRFGPKIGGFASDRLCIGWCEGGPGGPMMLRSPKLQKRAIDPEGPKMGVSKIAPSHNFFYLVSLAHGPNMRGCKRHPLVGPLGVSCP